MTHSEMAARGKSGHHTSNSDDGHDPSTTHERPSVQYPESPTGKEAQRLIGLGYVVGQVYPKSKRPVGGETRCTADPEEAARWWKADPDAGLFINLAQSGLVDVSSDSIEALHSFRERGLPHTMSFLSGSGVGHEHHLYGLPEGAPQERDCRSGELDLMSAGIAVVPPSVSDKGPYRWKTRPRPVTDLRPAPAWVIEALESHGTTRAERQSESTVDPDEPPIRLEGDALLRWRGEQLPSKPDGNVDESLALTLIANDLARAGMSAYGIDRMLRDRATELGIAKYEGRSDEHRRYAELATSAVAEFGLQAMPGRPSAERYRLLNIDDILDRSDPIWTVDGFLQANTIAAFVGEYGSFKSFAALGLAVSIAQGNGWMGFPIKRPGPVVYVTAEGVDSFKLRIEALQREQGLTRDDLRDRLFILDHAIHVTDELDVAGLLGGIRDLGLPEPPRLVVLDTLARTLGPGKRENAQEDMSEYVDGMDRLRTALDGSIVLTLHHNNAQGGMRGSTVLPGALTTIVGFEAEGAEVTLSCIKQKDGEPFTPITADRVVVDLSPPSSLYAPLVLNRTSVVLRKKTVSPTASGIYLTTNQRKVLETLRDEPSGRLSFTRLQDASGLAKTSFYNTRKALIDRALIEAEEVGSASYHRLTEEGRKAVELPPEGAEVPDQREGVKSLLLPGGGSAEVADRG